MGYFKWVAVFVGGWALVGCGSDGGNSAASGSATTADELCSDACAMPPPLSCPSEPSAATCTSKCKASVGTFFDKCKAQLNAYAKCGLGKGASDYECNADGEADLKTSVCSSELNAVVTCAGG